MEWRPWGFTEAVAAQSCSWLPQAETRFVGFQQTNLIKLTGAICFELCSLLAESVENLARVFFSLFLLCSKWIAAFFYNFIGHRHKLQREGKRGARAGECCVCSCYQLPTWP